MNTECIVCEKNIENPSDFICCGVCGKNYHLICAEITETTRRSARSLPWKCKKCVKNAKNNKTKHTNNDILSNNQQEPPSIIKQAKEFTQPPKPELSNQSIDTENLPSENIDGANSLLTSQLFIKELTDFKTSIMKFVEDKFVSYANKYEALISQNNEIIKSIQFMADQHEDLRKRINVMEKAQEIVQEELTAQKNHNNILLNTISKQDEKLDKLEYLSQICNIEIRGVPESDIENNTEVVKKISKIINYENTDVHSVITKIYRLGPKFSDKNPRPIVATFNTITLRDDFLSKFKTYKKSTTSMTNKINTRDLGLSQAAKHIYVSDQLTQKGKFLLSQTKKFARDNNYKYYWSTGGRILLRQTDTSKIISINNIADLDREKRQLL